MTILVIWNFVGFTMFAIFASLAESAVNCGVKTKELLTPYFFYEYIEMNIVGAWISAIFMNLACPILTIFIWISQLFFIGRR